MSKKSVPVNGEYTGEEITPGNGITGYLARTFVSFRNPVYRLYYLSMVGHWSSMHMQMLARNLLIFRIVDSEFVLGVLALANAVPMIAFTLPGGVWADRIQKKTIIQIGQVASIFITLGTMLAILVGYLSPAHPESWWVLVASGALQGGVMGFIMPARSSIISEITGQKHLMNAISLNNMGMNLFRIASPAFAGLLVDYIGFWAVYAVMTAMIIMSWLFILPIKPTRAETPPARKSAHGNSLGDILEGWRYVRGERTILLVLIFVACVNILGSPYSQLLPVFTEEILKVSATNMGLMIAISGVGAIIGSFILANLSNKKRGRVLIIAAVVLGLSLVGFAFSQNWYLSLFLIVFIGMGSTVQMTLGNSLVQYYTDAAYRGRIMSFFMLSFGLGSLGAFIAGTVAEGIGAPLAVGGLAVILIIVTFGIVVMTPRVRRLD